MELVEILAQLDVLVINLGASGSWMIQLSSYHQ